MSFFQTRFSLLFFASIYDNLEALKQLLKHGADPTYATSEGTTVLMFFVKRNQVEMAQACLDHIPIGEKKTNWVNGTTSSGWTALMSACNNENEEKEFAQFLIDNGAAVNTIMKTGWSAAHVAAKSGNIAALELLIKSGANMNIRAQHREFGQNLRVKDVTMKPDLLKLLEDKVN
jgi:ankyrin repeat protein